jgi:hypothetical protein
MSVSVPYIEEPTFIKNIKLLETDKAFANFTVEVDGEDFQVHKGILAGFAFN